MFCYYKKMESFSLFKSLLYRTCIIDEKKLSQELGFSFNQKEAEDRCKKYVIMYCDFSKCV